MAENGGLVDVHPVKNGLLEVLMEKDEEKHFGQIERDLDTLTCSGSAINDLELQLSQTRAVYRQTVVESKQKVEGMRRKLNTHIQKSQPFVEVWKKAREIQEASNRAAAQYDKAASQYSAAKEMITVAEQQLGERLTSEDPSSPSPLDLAWQEMLNHATEKVVITEKQRRDSELEHKRILEECNHVMEEYRIIERKLRSHIIKSRPYYEERYKCQQRITKLQQHIQHLENKIKESKRVYSATLRKLEELNMAMHENRRSKGKLVREDPRQTASAGHSPEHLAVPDGERSRTASLESLGEPGLQFTGSTGSLPSIGTSSVSDNCSTPDTNGEEAPAIPNATLHSKLEEVTYRAPQRLAPQLQGEIPVVKVNNEDERHTAVELVARCLASAINRLEEPENRTTHTLPTHVKHI